ncbi:MAG TPA: ACP S-malonyltransferase [Streptosporangiaceae bacterium]|jgi:trans-AT polyketide synthase/acyltransferase/oxidoreductase domain-containing protein
MALAFLFPGQGSQQPGMGAGLFDDHPDLVAAADSILGYPVRELCAGAGPRLHQTEYAQPALFVVSALACLRARRDGPEPAVLAGHSVGEYAALFAAGCLDFETCLRLVRRRGELMAGCPGGSMMAVLGVSPDRLSTVLAQAGIGGIDIANHNLPDQIVVAGPRGEIRAAAGLLADQGLGKCVPLRVSVAAHSRYMAPAASELAAVLSDVRFAEPAIPVLANVTARPYTAATAADLLSRHLVSPVRWWDTICALAEAGVDEIAETGPGEVLTKIWRRARRRLPGPRPAPPPPVPVSAIPAPTALMSCAPAAPAASRPPAGPGRAAGTDAGAGLLGSAAFRAEYRLRLAYLAGGLGLGVSGPELLLALASDGLLGFLGTAGRTLTEVEADLRALAPAAGGFGISLPAGLAGPAQVAALVEAGLRHNVAVAEVTGHAGVTAELIRWRFSGARRGPDGRYAAARGLLAKVGRAGQAAAFLRPAPADLTARLCAAGTLTEEEAAAAAGLPVADAVCAETGSGWLAGGDSGAALLAAVLAARDQAAARYGPGYQAWVGSSGGIGSPAAVASAFLSGADFVLTGSVNQCSAEARTSDAVKDLLAGAGPDDTEQAPAGELFELGGRTRVLARRGTLFAARAAALQHAYRVHAGPGAGPGPASGQGLAGLDPRLRRDLAGRYFGKPLEEVTSEVRDRLTGAERDRADREPRYLMARVFGAYFTLAYRAALAGDPAHRLNYQIPCGPAMGAFNQCVQGTPLADWRRRTVTDIAQFLMAGAAGLLGQRTGVPIAGHRAGGPGAAEPAAVTVRSFGQASEPLVASFSN